ncbi:ClpP/crotonase [Gonapodya prolifera JEL478]|uniref:ClpP/crotonase n=1 Tax=Gonapodya prolifera (strain JEL478) TaxID=1344416 RepID=A0A139AXL0_GONPJ|nr:ClpP/crotonase [Gonapodya prolifera JEL478]|eukprot:KXS21468.1 ClpP/crotonase [Gonapodya prolifera JEL478]
MATRKDVVVETIDKHIRILRLNRPDSFNAFGDNLLPELEQGLRDADADPNIVITVITGTGKFFSSGADVKQAATRLPLDKVEKPIPPSIELLRLLIDHTKVLVIALNGPAVGGGAAWFLGVADLVLCSDTAYAQVPFSALALVPEQGCGVLFPQSVGVRRATEFLMLGRQLSAQEMEEWGLVNRIYPSATFQTDYLSYLRTNLALNDATSLLETKRLIAGPLREGRMLAVFRAQDALAEMLASGRPGKRFLEKKGRLGRARGKL